MFLWSPFIPLNIIPYFIRYLYQPFCVKAVRIIYLVRFESVTQHTWRAIDQPAEPHPLSAPGFCSVTRYIKHFFSRMSSTRWQLLMIVSSSRLYLAGNRMFQLASYADTRNLGFKWSGSSPQSWQCCHLSPTFNQRSLS